MTASTATARTPSSAGLRFLRTDQTLFAPVRPADLDWRGVSAGGDHDGSPPGRPRLHHAHALARHQRDAPALDAFGLAVDDAQVGTLEHAPDHDLHLEQGERRAEAAPRAAAEGDPGVGVRRVVAEEALGAELARL